MSDDEDLKRAIALSLAESTRPAKNTADEPIVISSDEEDDPPTARRPAKPASPPKHSTSAAAPPPIAVSQATSSFLSERAQLEAARIERLKARQGGTGPSNPPAKRQRERERDPDDPFVSSDSDVARPPAKKVKPANAHASGSSSRLNTANTNGTGDEGPLFWDGELRQTANKYVDKEKDGRAVFRLSEILGKESDLKFVIMSSYVTDLAWIYSMLPAEVPVILVGQPGQDGATSVHNVLPNWVKVTPFLRGGRGAMHIKLILLFYKSGRLRVVIPSANFVDYDWRDIENSVWVQDVPARPKAIPPDRKADDFGSQLERVLQALNVSPGLYSIKQDHPEIPLTLIGDLRSKWDFSKIKAQLVPSIAGKHEGWSSVLRVGHPRLMRVVRLIGARADERRADKNGKGKGKAVKGRKIELECQGSSIGNYTPSWIDEFFCSARGASAEGWLDEGKGRRSKRLDRLFSQEGWKPWRAIKILFPSLNTVMESQLGINGAGTMFCQRKAWAAPKFPRPLFYDSNSKRGKVLMHSKMILATFSDSLASASNEGSSSSNGGTKLGTRAAENDADPDESVTEPESDEEIQQVDAERGPKVLGWLYVGSHNFTPSAWGYLSGSGVTPTLNITNYELGVVIPITKKEEVEEWPCWVRPPRKYGKDDEPWIQEDYL
ncbi:hypothetical protein M422DRAFT_30766 [Sphaerobolus stellatus SS14]|uniref:Phospholipase D/nuclease n=1 Tax=Sphaerobolus stellatus (strain SS14) TaxID=990650 RepID=A0A0C9VNT8_SPHS4|nr:hypothetical protein M422DRAFT_30766 [Sphaerobolus stellatus SS14]